MPIFEAELSDGRIVTVESDTEPTEEQILSAIGQERAPELPKPLDRSMMSPAIRENVFGESREDLARQMEAAQVDRGLSELAETAAGFGERAAYTISQMPSAPFDLLRRALPTQPILTPEQASAVLEPGYKALEYFSPFKPAPLGSLREQVQTGAKSFAANMLSGVTDPLFLLQAALAKRWPQPIARGFQAQMMLGVPGAVSELQRATTVPELTERALSLGTTFGLPLLIESRLQRAARLLPESARAALPTEAELKGAPDAIEERRIQEGREPEHPGVAEVRIPAETGDRYRAVPTAPVETQAPLLLELSPTEKAYLEAERAALDVPVEVTPTLPEGQPFAAGEIATIDRAGKRILVNPTMFSDWLRKVPEARRSLAVKSLLSEERIHLAVSDADASAFSATMTALEKALSRRRYRGTWTGAWDDVLDGHEAVRFRLQQLARITPREIAETDWLSREGFSVRTITVLESVIRGVRKVLGTEASLEAGAILDRLQGNLATARGILEGTAAPAAIRKKQLQDPKQERLFLPPLGTTEGVERAVSTYTPSAVELERVALRHVDEAISKGVAPDFHALQRQVGIAPQKLYYLWQDTLMKRLPLAKGEQVRKMLSDLKLGRDVAEALRPGEKEPRLREIADPQIFTRGEQILMPTLGRISKAQYARQMMPEQRARHAALGAIMDKLMQQTGEAPKKAWESKEIGPEDIQQRYAVTGAPTKADIAARGFEAVEPPAIETAPMFRAIRPEEARDPSALGRLLTTGAAIEATGKGAPPRTVSRNLVALKDQFGKIALVSVWRDPRTGPRVTNPSAPSQSSRPVNAALLKEWTPVAMMTLRDPRQNFHRAFDSQEAFDRYFGDVAIEATAGIRTGMFAGPSAGIAEAQAGIRAPGRVSAPAEGYIPPPEFVSKTARELTMPVERIPPTVVRGEVLPKRPGPDPTLPLPKPPEMLPGPLPDAMQIEAESVFKAPSYAKPTGKITVVGKPLPLQPGTFLRAGLPHALAPRAPAARMKQAQAEWGMLKNAFAASIARRGVLRDLPRLLDAAERAAEKFAMGADQHIRLKSQKPLTQAQTKALTRQEFRANQQEAEMVRRAAKAVIAAGKLDPQGNWKPNRGELAHFLKQLALARIKAENMAASPNPVKAYVGRRWMRNAELLKAEVEYAHKNWQSKELHATARAVREELAETATFENMNGSTVKLRENYIPGRYEGEFWSDNTLTFAGRRMLGAAYRLPKRFANYYEAARYGPYIPTSYDVADLVAHRVATGHRMVERRLWLESLKSINDPDSLQPIATDPAPIIGDIKIKDPTTGITHTVKGILNWQSPSVEHELVWLSRSKHDTPVAIRRGFAPLVRALLAPSYIEEALPMGKEALRLTGMLKHGVILLWDSFHPGRLLQYTVALGGLKPPDYRSAYTALAYRASDLVDAVRKGFVTQGQADWATTRIKIGGTRLTRQNVLDELVNAGLNVTRITDALYRHAVQNVPIVGEPWHRFISHYNEPLFGRFIPGIMSERAVGWAEKMAKENPTLPPSKLFADVARDINIFYGNMGRQGIFKRKTFQDLMQLVFLAPVWQEGLWQKEIRGAARLAGAGARLAGLKIPYRRGLPALGTLGTGLGRGLAAYFMATQVLNLITRGQFTWDNPEEGHKLDAWIPIGGGRGLWLSPMSVFAEVTHDFQRLFETKDKAWDAIVQMGENRAGPIGKMSIILLTGKSPLEQYYATTPGVLWGGVSQVVPMAGASPISLSVPTRALAHEAFPEYVSPPAPGALQRWAAGSGMGIKVQVSTLPAQQIGRKAREFLEQNNLLKTTGWQEMQTDEPSYAKLRTAIRNDDLPEAVNQYQELLKQRTPAQVMKSMEQWARRPFTGNNQYESLFKLSLNRADAELYSQAQIQRMEELAKFREFWRTH